MQGSTTGAATHLPVAASSTTAAAETTQTLEEVEFEVVLSNVDYSTLTSPAGLETLDGLKSVMRSELAKGVGVKADQIRVDVKPGSVKLVALLDFPPGSSPSASWVVNKVSGEGNARLHEALSTQFLQVPGLEKVSQGKVEVGQLSAKKQIVEKAIVAPLAMSTTLPANNAQLGGSKYSPQEPMPTGYAGSTGTDPLPWPKGSVTADQSTSDLAKCYEDRMTPFECADLAISTELKIIAGTSPVELGIFAGQAAAMACYRRSETIQECGHAGAKAAEKHNALQQERIIAAAAAAEYLTILREKKPDGQSCYDNVKAVAIELGATDGDAAGYAKDSKQRCEIAEAVQGPYTAAIAEKVLGGSNADRVRAAVHEAVKEVVSAQLSPKVAGDRASKAILVAHGSKTDAMSAAAGAAAMTGIAQGASTNNAADYAAKAVIAAGGEDADAVLYWAEIEDWATIVPDDIKNIKVEHAAAAGLPSSFADVSKGDSEQRLFRKSDAIAKSSTVSAGGVLKAPIRQLLRQESETPAEKPWDNEEADRRFKHLEQELRRHELQLMEHSIELDDQMKHTRGQATSQVDVAFTITNVAFNKLSKEDKQGIERAVQRALGDMTGIPEGSVDVQLSAGSVHVDAELHLPADMRPMAVQDALNGPQGLEAIEQLLMTIEELPGLRYARTGTVGWFTNGMFAQVPLEVSQNKYMLMRDDNTMDLRLYFYLTMALVCLVVALVVAMAMAANMKSEAAQEKCSTAEKQRLLSGAFEPTSGKHSAYYHEPQPLAPQNSLEPELEPENEPSEALPRVHTKPSASLSSSSSFAWVSRAATAGFGGGQDLTQLD